MPPAIDIGAVFRQLKDRGYCLWVGAGIGVHASSAGNEKVPTWAALAENLELAAELDHQSDLSLPERLDLVLHALGRERFQRELRERIYDPLARSLLEAARTCGKNQADPIPREVRQLARLGARANPIVNFNVEPMTSLLLGGAEPHAIRCFVPPVPGGSSLLSGVGHRTQSERFNRSIYHPHGAVTVSGICVMTASEYRAMRGTLALQLAVHAAFQTDLVIVGMSLDDDYLREQLACFRDQIPFVWWFTVDAPRPDVEKWCLVNRIAVVRPESWSAFWEAVEVKLPTPEHLSIANNWLFTVSEASSVLSGHAHHAHILSEFRKLGSTEAELVGWKRALEMRGYPIPEVHEEASLEPFPPHDAEVLAPILRYMWSLRFGAARSPSQGPPASNPKGGGSVGGS